MRSVGLGLLAAIVALGGCENGEDACGPGTVWDGEQCVVAVDESAGPGAGAGASGGGGSGSGSGGSGPWLDREAPGPCSENGVDVLPYDVDYEYDDAGRLLRFSVPDGPVLQTMSYGPQGWLQQAVQERDDEIFTFNFSYDSERVTTLEEVYQLKGQAPMLNTRWDLAYDAEGRLVSAHGVDTNDEALPTATFDWVSPTEVHAFQDGVPVGAYFFDADGFLASIEYDSGGVTTFTRDGSHRLTEQLTTSDSGENRFRWMYDGAGNLMRYEWSTTIGGEDSSWAEFDYSCWKDRDIPTPPTICAGGGAFDSNQVGSPCWFRLRQNPIGVY